MLAAAAGGASYPDNTDFPTVEQSPGEGSGATSDQAVERIGETRHRHDAGRRVLLRIARELGIAESTVFSYHRNIKDKMGKRTWSDVLDEFRSLHLF